MKGLSCYICSHWSLPSALPTCASMKAGCCCGSSISLSSTRRWNCAGNWILSVRCCIQRSEDGKCRRWLSALANAEDQTTPTLKKIRKYDVRRLQLMHWHPVGVEKLYSGNAAVFPTVGRPVREVGLYHRDTMPPGHEGDDEAPSDSVVGELLQLLEPTPWKSGNVVHKGTCAAVSFSPFI